MKPIGHVMILASAGSGKTYALTNRFVALLARGVPPERIAALTFTRKAAGEFFDEILGKLARAAADPRAAAELGRAVGAPDLGVSGCLRLLRSVTDAVHRLRLGTLDSFFARIARAFPLELGLAGDFEVLEEHAARLERRRVLQRMFARTGELAAAQQEFIEAFKRATFGVEEKSLGRRLDAFLDEHLEIYLAAPAAELWGDPARIWPEGNPFLAGETDVPGAMQTIEEFSRSGDLGEKQRARWAAFLADLAVWTPGVTFSTELAYVLKKAVDAWPDLQRGTAVLAFDRQPQHLDARACAALAVLVRHVVGGELAGKVATTRGIHAVVRGYDAIYHDAVRRAGRLTFGDVQRLLQPDAGDGAFPGGSAEGREVVDYRLDGRIDHWLLDEFQDTSRGQWSVLKNLIDEVVQDPSGERTFFCVGDVKQAIYAWREGDARLFREIFQHYNAGDPGTIAEERLVASWRSGPPIIEMVNAVFGNASVLADLFPNAATRTWNDEWRTHVSALPERSGQSALLLAGDEAGRWARVVELLLEIRPLERGLTCAVLVPKNATATALADHLRREAGVPAVAESDLHVCTDNPLGAALLALFQAAAHPGDTLAWEHVQMTPLGAILADEGIHRVAEAAPRLLAELHAEGFERTAEAWLRKIEARLGGGDAFTRLRARQFAAAAARYDQTGGRDVAEFVQFMERHVVRDAEGASVIRVMTVHKAKGLGFDVVILPDLQGTRIDARRGDLAVAKAPDGGVQWILDLPNKLVCEADPVLTRHVEAAEAEACYEAISLLYVALTRAKRAMYAIIQPVGRSVSRNYPKLLSETLGAEAEEVRVGGLSVSGSWMSGDPDWHRAQEAAVAAAAPAAEIEPWVPAGGAVRIRRESRRPSSGGTTGGRAAAPLFALERTAGGEFGSAVHAVLAGVEWREEGVAAGPWLERGWEPDAVAEAIACVQAGALAEIWRRRPRAEVWRERAFEMVLDEAWVSGVFDRVIVERDERGAVTRVTVCDFKTERVPDEAALWAAAARHAAQVDLYRRVAAALAGVPLSAVAGRLVFTKAGRSVPVPAGEDPS